MITSYYQIFLLATIQTPESHKYGEKLFNTSPPGEIYDGW